MSEHDKERRSLTLAASYPRLELATFLLASSQHRPRIRNTRKRQVQ